MRQPFGELIANIRDSSFSLEFKDLILVVLVRHGEKNREELIALGAQQIYTTGELLQLLFREIRLNKKQVDMFYSGTLRTKQSIFVLAAAMRMFEMAPGREPLFSPEPASQELEFSNAHYLRLTTEIREAGGTVSAALKLSSFMRLCKEHVTSGILQVASQLSEQEMKVAVVASHSPMVELATLGPDKMNFGIGLADCMLCVVNPKEQKIVQTLHVPCPLNCILLGPMKADR